MDTQGSQNAYGEQRLARLVQYQRRTTAAQYTGYDRKVLEHRLHFAAQEESSQC